MAPLLVLINRSLHRERQEVQNEITLECQATGDAGDGGPPQMRP